MNNKTVIVTGASAGIGAANNLAMEEAKNKFLVDSHIERYGEPEEIAESMAFLLPPGGIG